MFQCHCDGHSWLCLCMTLRDTGRGCIHPTLLHCPGCMLQRYVETGQARILSKTRGVVGLHKNRFCFPLLLCVARLSGVGSDALFIGVMKHEPSIGTLDKPIMRVSCTGKLEPLLQHLIVRWAGTPADLVYVQC